ncbi:hypothetical protein [Nostoc sp. 'Peltigera membranacea cyanobiont' 232]|uniref:hypothetical protein n=1 Tax=Nostoc sp. 'Peltigera membranacea cyanobiont' 232 TaxID=2014531 RepID=UPI00117F64C1|nr:hypothetical protein [Nostoc sp. 'Peltigera membranacea cyanobiont' 232]
MLTEKETTVSVVYRRRHRSPANTSDRMIASRREEKLNEVEVRSPPKRAGTPSHKSICFQTLA